MVKTKVSDYFSLEGRVQQQHQQSLLHCLAFLTVALMEYAFCPFCFSALVLISLECGLMYRDHSVSLSLDVMSPHLTCTVYQIRN